MRLRLRKKGVKRLAGKPLRDCLEADFLEVLVKGQGMVDAELFHGAE